MQAKRIIPCLDVKDGRVVKGINFVDLRDAADPVEAAGTYNDEGADEITFLDITASHEKRATIVDVVAETAKVVTVPLIVGGGIRNIDDIRRIMDAGADKVGINTSAVQNPDLIDRAAKKFGGKNIIAAVDGKKTTEGGWEVYIHGGRTPTGKDAVEWSREVESRGAGEILLTSMDRDGTKEGYDLELTKAVSDAVNIPVTASGGVGTLEHMAEGILAGGADAVLAASIFHFGIYSIKQAKQYLRDKGIEVNL